MNEFSNHLEKYLNYWFADFSKLIPVDSWGNKQMAEQFLQKYWLSEPEYLTKWKPIQNQIFIRDKCLPELIYDAEFKIMALRGGCLFLEDEFKQLQNALIETGENFIIIIQHTSDFTEGEPLFKMKFPVNINWEELMSGNYISAVLFEMNYNNYFVFGSNDNWGKYSANDYEIPLDIIAFKEEIEPIFKKHFKQDIEEYEEMIEILPKEYKKIV